jgi:hypothetical protein
MSCSPQKLIVFSSIENIPVSSGQPSDSGWKQIDCYSPPDQGSLCRWWDILYNEETNRVVKVAGWDSTDSSSTPLSLPHVKAPDHIIILKARKLEVREKGPLFEPLDEIYSNRDLRDDYY